MADGKPSRTRRRVLLAILFLLLAGGGAGAWALYGTKLSTALGDFGSDGTPEEAMDKYFPVKRGDFNITVLVDGTLNALKRHDLRCEAKGHFELNILEVVEDKTKVEKDQVVVRLSDEKYKEQLDKLRLQLDDALRDLALSKEDLQILESTNKSNLKSTFDKLRSAQEALQKYRDLEAPQARKSKQSAISDAEDKVEDAEKKLSQARDEMTDAQSTNPEEAAKLEDAVTKAEKEVVAAQRALDKANHDYRVYKQYDHPQKLRGLEESLVQAQLNLRKTLVDAKGRVIQAQRKIENHKKRIDTLREQIKGLEEDIDKLVLTAPVAGIVSLGNPNRRHWQEPKEIKVGVTVRPREVIASIPDLSKFEVDVEIPEEFRSRVHVGQTAKLRSPAFPDLTMEGKITSIAPMARRVVRWDRNSPRVYDTKIKTDTPDERLMPGMTVKVEIIVETVEDVLHVPVEAVYNKEGKTVCQVRTLTGGRETPVETGRASVHYVEILSGLKEGEEVLLHRRPAEAGSGGP